MNREIRLKKAVWRYLIDHSFINQHGDYEVRFIIGSYWGFWRNVARRKHGYHRKVYVPSKKLRLWLKANKKRL